MSFLYPTFLWGLLALAIPVIIHLFNFRRAKKIYFSNVSFLENVKESSSSKLKVKHLLVLLCRLLVIAFLVFAFAQPFLPGNEKGMNSSLVKIYLDNSQSTSNISDNDLTGLNNGISFLENIIDLYSNETKFQIVTNDFAPSSINPKSKEKALELATELDYSYLIRSKAEIINKINPVENLTKQQDIYILSDFQKSSFSVNQTIPRDSVNNYKVIPVQYTAHNNIFVDSMYLENPFLISSEVNKLHLKVKNIGTDDANDIILKLFINEEQSASASIDISQNASSEIVFDLNFELKDLNYCKISFEDFPLTFDNEYFFTLNLLKKITICEIHSNEAKDYIGQVYSENELFDYHRFENGSVDYNTVQLSDMLIINQLSNIDNSILNIANDLTNKGKSVLVIPAKTPDSLSIQSLLGQKVKTLEKGEKLALENPDVTNPFFENIFTEIDNKTEMPDATNIITWSPIGIDLLKTKNGLPFLTKIQKKGSVYMLATPLQDEFTNFHKHALFVPVLYRMAALSSNNYTPLSYSIDDPIVTIKVDSIKNDQLFKLIRGEEEYIPEQRISGNNLILDIPKYLLTPGFYDLQYNGITKNVLAFNYSKSESDPTQLSVEEISKAFGSLKNVEIMESADADSFSKEMKERYQGINLWKYALVLSLIFLLIETLFLRFL
ncbi:BatA domain-containing protein [Reichenbachiella sp. MALMAid0571]|uniref:BatA domain-containing protein n=1 Tax=Reichenbachiella sp. MALMAid0571 TaxID=3143939 RepID=UPI0032DEA9E7